MGADRYTCYLQAAKNVLNIVDHRQTQARPKKALESTEMKQTLPDDDYNALNSRGKNRGRGRGRTSRRGYAGRGRGQGGVHNYYQNYAARNYGPPKGQFNSEQFYALGQNLRSMAATSGVRGGRSASTQQIQQDHFRRTQHPQDMHDRDMRLTYEQLFPKTNQAMRTNYEM